MPDLWLRESQSATHNHNETGVYLDRVVLTGFFQQTQVMS
jgi:hypothetical protein